MSNPAPALVVSAGQRAALELSKSQTASHREEQRAQVLLTAAEGLANELVPACSTISLSASISTGTTPLWRATGNTETGAVQPDCAGAPRGGPIGRFTGPLIDKMLTATFTDMLAATEEAALANG